MIMAHQKVIGFNYLLPGRGLAYYFMQVTPTKEVLLLRLIAEDVALNLDDYGEVIASGYGEPPQSLLKKLREEYGANV
ncbi:MAG: hypothetical protein EBV03_06620 [Proteobacteria bacterium]|nr:hypothetical protein [Pseudomonadota bacterium]